MNMYRFCRGKGYYEEKLKKHEGFVSLLTVSDIICEKCCGTGELDWIEEIRGKRLSTAKRILSYHKINEELKKRAEDEYKQKLQTFYEGFVPI